MRGAHRVRPALLTPMTKRRANDRTTDKLAIARMAVAIHAQQTKLCRALPANALDKAFDALESANGTIVALNAALKRLHISAARTSSTESRLARSARYDAHSLASTAGVLESELGILLSKLNHAADLRSCNQNDQWSLSNITEELAAIKREFHNVSFEAPMLNITTENMVLSHYEQTFDFGQFIMSFNVVGARQGDDEVVEIAAVNPQFDRSGLYYHPHVTGKSLCTGEGGRPLASALTSGRFYDAAIIVNQILSTYNPDSPYVGFSAWTGEESEEDDDYFTCEDCGDRWHVDEMNRCESCDQDICDNCSNHCDATHITVCDSCISDARCECDSIGASGCLCRENDPCVLCGEIVADSELEHCSHAHRHTNRNSPATPSQLCSSCLSSRADSDSPCMLPSIDAIDGTTTSVVCEHFATRNCAMLDHGLEEVTITPDSDTEEETESVGTTGVAH